MSKEKKNRSNRERKNRSNIQNDDGDIYLKIFPWLNLRPLLSVPVHEK